jgi:V8-like Glu-specific endopeptidase
MANKSKFRGTQNEDGGSASEGVADYEKSSSRQSSPPGDSSSRQEVVDEVAGSGESQESDEVGYSREETSSTNGTEGLMDPHASMSSPPAPYQPSGDEAGGDEAAEEAGAESGFESVEGWKEGQLTEAGEEQEPIIEAYYAEAQSEEFFPLLALVAPALKVIIPQLAGALVQQGAKLLSPKLVSILDRLRKLGLNPAQAKAAAGILGKRLESYPNGNESAEVDEATLEALDQQVEALEVVIGKDDRVRMQDTTVVPWKRICHLRITAANRRTFLGTGTFIGPRTIVTAGHCVYMHGQGGWAREIVVTPGRDDDKVPFQKYTGTSFRSVRGWVLSKSRNYDYGAIILPRTAAVSSQIGAFGFGSFSDSELRSMRLNTAGYPGDKPSGTMWFHGRKAKAVLPEILIYDIDTAGGQSGSPVWIRNLSTRKRHIVAIHTNGAASGNSATRITKPVFDNLKKWRSDGGAVISYIKPMSAIGRTPDREAAQPSAED